METMLLPVIGGILFGYGLKSANAKKELKQLTPETLPNIQNKTSANIDFIVAVVGVVLILAALYQQRVN